ncbi:MAG: alpha/beta hydrolase [Arcobacteraceae bacterium]
MKKRVLILHGWGGSLHLHWQAQLAQSLVKENYEVSFPTLPNMDFPKLNEWKEFIKKEVEEYKPHIVVCHSLGNIIWLHLLDELNIKLDKLMLVAPVRLNCDIEELKTFFPYPIPKNLKSQKAIMFCSNNDPYLNVNEAENLSQQLHIEMIMFQNAGHINADSGFGEFQWALDWINEEKLKEPNL